MYFRPLLIEIYLNTCIGHVDFLANIRMLKFGSELRYGIRSPNVRTSVDIPSCWNKTYAYYFLKKQQQSTIQSKIYISLFNIDLHGV